MHLGKSSIWQMAVPVAVVAIAGLLSSVTMRGTRAQIAAEIDASSRYSVAAIHPEETAAALAAYAPAPCPAAPESMAKFDAGFPRLAARLQRHEPVRIVAIGSSSTAGAGASSPANSYPAQLAAELRRLYRGVDITVLNRGANGEVTADMIARLETSVLVEKPDLVIWQLGANTVMREQAVSPTEALAREGIKRIRAIGADVMLYDLQYAPKMLSSPLIHEMNGLLDKVAASEHVAIFHRFELMRYWHEDEGVPIEKFISPDAMHQNDWSYACVSRKLGGMIAATVNEALPPPAPVASLLPMMSPLYDFTFQ